MNPRIIELGLGICWDVHFGFNGSGLWFRMCWSRVKVAMQKDVFFLCHPLRSRDNQAGPIVLGFTAGQCQSSMLLVEIPPGCNLSLAKAVLTAG